MFYIFFLMILNFTNVEDVFLLKKLFFVIVFGYFRRYLRLLLLELFLFFEFWDEQVWLFIYEFSFDAFSFLLLHSALNYLSFLLLKLFFDFLSLFFQKLFLLFFFSKLFLLQLFFLFFDFNLLEMELFDQRLSLLFCFDIIGDLNFSPEHASVKLFEILFFFSDICYLNINFF